MSAVRRAWVGRWLTGLRCTAFVALVALFADALPATAAADVQFTEPFRLESTYGGGVTPAALQGKWLLVYLGQTACGERCRPALTLMHRTLEGLGWWERRQLRPAMISVDPQRDTTESVRSYLSRLGMGGGVGGVEGWVGNTLNTNLAVRSMGVSSADVCRSDSALPPNATTAAVDEAHVPYIWIVSPDRRLASFLIEGMPVDKAVAHLRKTIASGGS